MVKEEVGKEQCKKKMLGNMLLMEKGEQGNTNMKVR
jgi:hypothetical protein